MSLKPGDTLDLQFTTRSPATGAATAADSTPTATLVHNGVDDGAVTLTVTNPSGAIYKVAGTIPSSGYVAGDTIQVRIGATVASVADEAIILTAVLDTKRVSDLQDVSLSSMAGTLATASGLSAAEAAIEATCATASGYATSTQATALLSAVNNLNNLSALANLFGPSAMVPPPSSTIVYVFSLIIRDSEGNLVAADSTPTVTATNLAATDLDSRVSSLSNPGTGVYTFTYTVDSTDLGSAVADEISLVAACTVSSNARRADLKVALVAAEQLTSIATILSVCNQFGFDGDNNVKSTPQTPVTLATSQPDYAPATAAGLAALVATVGTPAGESVSADVAAVNTKTTNLPGSPAAVGSAMTLAASEDIYLAEVVCDFDDLAATDEWTISWSKNGQPITSGITASTLTVAARSDGTVLINGVTPTQVGSSGIYKYDGSGGSRIGAGETGLATVTATIGGSERTFRKVAKRDRVTS